MTRGSVTQTRSFQWTGSDLTQSTNPENGTVTYQYDGAHHVTQRVDAKGQRTTYQYDSYGRLLHTRHYDSNNNALTGPDVDYVYDEPSRHAWGRLASVTFHAGQYVYGYNTAGRVTMQQFIYNSLTTMEADYQWDNRGRMTRAAYPMNGGTYNYQYDAMSRLVGMADDGGTTLASAQYDSTSLLSQLSWGGNSGFSESQQYNQLNQLTRLTTTQTGTTIMDMGYGFGNPGANNGRVTQTVDYVAMDTQTFGYDALNRLTGVTSSIGNNESFSYDGFGNLTYMNGTTFTVDATTNRRSGLEYDANGNVTHTTTGGQTWYGWDAENRMVQSNTSANQGVYNYLSYDPWGKRVTGNGEVYFYSLSGQRVATMVDNGDGTCGPKMIDGRWAVNVYFGSKLIKSNGKLVATDRLGSVRATDTGERMRYKAYGQEWTSTNDGQDKVATYHRDGTNLDYADQRYYGPNTGAFFSPDPSGASAADSGNPNSWNMYAYAGGDPINFNDPDGLATSNCGDSLFSYNGSVIGTVSQALNLTSNVTILAETEFTEAGHGSSVNSTAEEDMIGEVVMNRWALVNGYWYLYPTAGRPPLDVSAWGTPPAQGQVTGLDAVTQNGQFAVWNGSSLTTSAQNNLNAALSSAFDSKLCSDLAWAIGSAISFISSPTVNLYYDKTTGLAPLAFNSANLTIPSYMGKIGSFGDANTFYGAPVGDFSANLIPIPRPKPVRPPRKPGRPRGGPRQVQ